MIVDSIFPKDRPQVYRTCWIIDLNQTHSWLTSRTWFGDVIVMVCFI